MIDLLSYCLTIGLFTPLCTVLLTLLSYCPTVLLSYCLTERLAYFGRCVSPIVSIRVNTPKDLWHFFIDMI